MTLIIELPPELEERLQREAAEHGLPATEFARALLEERLVETPAPAEVLPDVPRATAEEIETLRREGTVIERFGEMLGNFWPEGEDVDDFVSARRAWQQEGGEDYQGVPGLILLS
jgi:hypothetical protein